MSLLDQAKMPSLKDKIAAQAAEAEKVREQEEKKDAKEAVIIKKRARKN